MCVLIFTTSTPSVVSLVVVVALAAVEMAEAGPRFGTSDGASIGCQLRMYIIMRALKQAGTL